MRNIPTVTKNLLILNILAFIAGIMLSRMGIDLNNILGLVKKDLKGPAPWIRAFQARYSRSAWSELC